MDIPARNSIDLEGIRADGWFDELADEIPEFEQLCQVVGRRFVAFSFITSVRIASISYDPQAPHNSLVDFNIGESEEQQRMTLADLRERLGAALLTPDDEVDSLSAAPDAEELRRYIGRRYLLLAPIFGITLESIEVGGGQEPALHLDLGHSKETISVQGLRDVLHNAVRSEVARARPNQPFSIDFKKVPQAEEANARGDWDETIALLGAWPGPLSMFLRTPQGQALGDSERSKLVRALGALGEAYLRNGQGDWAEDVLRLGIQFGQELEASGPLFALLGQSRVDTERYGEAIGLLRRALALGTDKRFVLPDLAKCFARRGRNVAAMACIEDGRAAGLGDDEFIDILESVEQELGGAYDRLRDYVSGD
ncbi:MAG: hypothetical protein OXT09_26245 [Myxococcales bacterium]|nr:hypothetical protein [Myxococcales bacterium]